MNSPISFVFSHTKTEGYPPLSQLIATYKGKEIDGKEKDHKYSFVTKFLSQKKIDSMGPNQTLAFKGEYIWLKAAPNRKGEQATWIKIKKNEVINKLGIEENELTLVHTSKELQELMSKKVYQTLQKQDHDKLEGVDQLITTLIKSILCFFVVGPAAKSMIREQISNIDKNAVSNGLEKLYVSESKELLDSVKNNLKKENPKALLFFGDEKISEIIDELLIVEANKKLKQENNPEWNDNKLNDLNILRDLDAFIGNPNGIIEYEKLKGMKAKDVPIAKVAEIPVTEENKAKLEEIFTDVLVELHTDGKLDNLETGKDPRALLLQLDYAVKFLEVFYFFPTNLFLPADSVLRKIQRDDGEKIVNFTIQNGSSMGEVTSSTALSMENLRDSMRIYDMKIRPQILDFIKDYEINNAVPNLINLYLDTFTIKDVGKNYVALTFWNKLSVSEQEFFTVDGIQDLLCMEIERTLVVNYHLTSTQLSNIRDYRKKISEEIDRYKVFNDKLSNCTTPEEIHKLLHEKENQVVDLNFPLVFQGYEISVLDQLKLKNSLEMRDRAIEHLYKIRMTTKLTKKTELLIEKLESKLYKEIIKFTKYDEQMKETVSRLESENVAQGRTTPEIRQLLINTKVMGEVDAGQNSPLLTPQQQKALMNFEFYFNDLRSRRSLWEVPDKVKMSENQTAKNLEFLEELRKDPQLIQVLESFKQKQPNNDIQIVLEKVPPFFHGLIKRMFSVKEETVSIVNKIPAGLSENTIDFLLDYVKKIEKMEKMEKELEVTLKKADDLLKKFDDGQSITKQEKLTLKELGLIDFALIVGDGRFSNNMGFSFMRELKSLGFEKANPILSRFGENVEKAQNVWNKLQDILPNEIGSHYQPGDIVASNLKKAEIWKGRPLSIFMRLFSFFTSGVGHGAKLYRDKENRIGVSEINYKREVNSLHLINLLQSDIWRLNLAPLVPSFLEKNLKEVYGDDWENKIQQLYSDIENGIHLNYEKLLKLENESERMELAGLANYPILATLLKGKKVKGHERDYEKDLRKIHQDFILNKDTPIEGKEIEKNIEGKEIKKNPKMICSEFVSKVTIAALIELNNQISEQLVKKGGRFSNREILKNNHDLLKEQGYHISREVSAYVGGVRHFGPNAEITKKAEKEWKAILKRLDYSDEDIELTIRIGNKDILDLPYSKKERIKAIHPGRMVQLLVDRGCAVKMELPPKLDLLFDVEVPEKKQK